MDTDRENDKYLALEQPLAPFWNADSRVLILGSFPSPLSRAQGFFYGNPRNRFWQVTAGVFNDATPQTIDDKKALLRRHHLALWDVLQRCEIIGAADSSIRNALPADITPLLRGAPLRLICCNGGTAHAFYRRYLLPQTGRDALCLPSTSPANAAWSLPRLIDAWRVLRDETE